MLFLAGEGIVYHSPGGLGTLDNEFAVHGWGRSEMSGRQLGMGIHLERKRSGLVADV